MSVEHVLYINGLRESITYSCKSTADPSVEHDITIGFLWDSCWSIFIFLCSGFVDHHSTFSFLSLCCMSFELRFLITTLVSLKFELGFLITTLVSSKFELCN
jgi:hypothetical protein